jgi:hypothetical protein
LASPHGQEGDAVDGTSTSRPRPAWTDREDVVDVHAVVTEVLAKGAWYCRSSSLGGCGRHSTGVLHGVKRSAPWWTS